MPYNLDNYLQKLALVESGGDPNARNPMPGVTAEGLYQFVDKTWNDISARHKLNYLPEDKFDPDKSRQVAEIFTQENKDYAENILGREVNDAELYLMHFLGPGGAIKVLTNPEQAIESLVDEQSIKNNPLVFENVLTGQDIVNWAGEKMQINTNLDITNANTSTDTQELDFGYSLNQQEEYGLDEEFLNELFSNNNNNNNNLFTQDIKLFKEGGMLNNNNPKPKAKKEKETSLNLDPTTKKEVENQLKFLKSYLNPGRADVLKANMLKYKFKKDGNKISNDKTLLDSNQILTDKASKETMSGYNKIFNYLEIKAGKETKLNQNGILYINPEDFKDPVIGMERLATQFNFDLGTSMKPYGEDHSDRMQVGYDDVPSSIPDFEKDDSIKGIPYTQEKSSGAREHIMQNHLNWPMLMSMRYKAGVKPGEEIDDATLKYYQEKAKDDKPNNPYYKYNQYIRFRKPKIKQLSREIVDNTNTNNINNTYSKEGGLLNNINTGGTHEESKLGGVPISRNKSGGLNFVEEGETITPNNYVLSNSLFLDKQDIERFSLPDNFKNLSLADAAKKANKLSEERNNTGDYAKSAQRIFTALENINELKKNHNNSLDEFILNKYAKDGLDLDAGSAISTAGNLIGSAIPQNNKATSAASGAISGAASIAPLALATGPAAPFVFAGGAILGALPGLLNNNNNINQENDQFNAFANNNSTAKFKSGGKLNNSYFELGGEEDPEPQSWLEKMGLAFYKEFLKMQGDELSKRELARLAKEEKKNKNYDVSKDKKAISYINNKKINDPVGINDFTREVNRYRPRPTNNLQRNNNNNDFSPTYNSTGIEGPLLPETSIENIDQNSKIRNVGDYSNFSTDFRANKFDDDNVNSLYLDIPFLGNNNFSPKAKPTPKPTPKSRPPLDKIPTETYGPEFTPELEKVPTDPAGLFKTGPTADPFNINPYTPNNDQKDPQSPTKPKRDNNYANLLRFAPLASLLYGRNKPEVEYLDRIGSRFQPTFLDEERFINAANNQYNTSRELVRNASNGSGSTQRANELGLLLQSTTGIGNVYAQETARRAQQDAQAQEFNRQTDMFNVGQSNQEKIFNAQNRAASEAQRRSDFMSALNSLGNIGRENYLKDVAKNTYGVNPRTGVPIINDLLPEENKENKENKYGGKLSRLFEKKKLDQEKEMFFARYNI